MEHDHWEIGLSGENLDDLLASEQAGMTLWFMAGYLKGLTDSSALHSGERQMVLEADGDQGWRLRYAKSESDDA